MFFKVSVSSGTSFFVICINTSKGQNPVLLLPATLAEKNMSYLALKEPVEAAREEALNRSALLLRAPATHQPLSHKSLLCFQRLLFQQLGKIRCVGPPHPPWAPKVFYCSQRQSLPELAAREAPQLHCRARQSNPPQRTLSLRCRSSK